MQGDNAPEWVPFQVAKWIAGTSELDAMAEYVFFRLVLLAYSEGSPLLSQSERVLAMRCKIGADQFRENVDLLCEFGKAVRTPDGLLIPSTERRLAEAMTRITGRRRGAEISRRMRFLKAEGKDAAQISQIISREFPDDQSDDQAPIKKDRKQTNKQTHTKGVQGEAALFDDLEKTTDAGETAVSMWNDFAAKAGLPRVQNFTAARRAALAKRLHECGGIDGWAAALEKVGSSDFLLGKSGRGDWKADFDFLMQARSFTRLMEGGYQGGARGGAGNSVMNELKGMANER